MTDYDGGTIWNVETGEELQHLPPQVTASHLLPDGHTTLVSIGNRLELWDIYTPGWELSSQSEHEDFVMAIAYSSDNLKALSGGGTFCQSEGDNRLILWDTTTREILHEMTGHEAGITATAFSSDSRYALSGSSDGITILWDVNTGIELKRFAYSSLVSSVAFTADNHAVIVGYASEGCGDKQEVIVWNIEDSSIIHRLEGGLYYNDGFHTWTEISPDKQLVAFLSFQMIRVVNIATEEEVARIAHGNALTVPYFAADSQTIFAGDSNGLIIEWDIATGQIVQTLDTGKQVLNVAVSPDNQYLATVHLRQGQTYCTTNNDVEFVLWDLATGQSTRHWNMPVCGFNSLEFSSDGQMLMAGSHRTLHTYTFSDNRLVLEWLRANRYIREFTCEERQQYRIEPLCAE
jgi:WD40 repeat protein